ncbi:MAG: S-layer family protein [Coleofasciculaceae cyanobacterium RL_1_1]|nr:S-layer family protein [Coleofasciculaceae cyanobacterium RL_1_1]
MTVRDGATLRVNSTGEGEQAGNLSIQVDRLVLDTGATIEAETATATEGNIIIAANTIQLRRQAGISGNATGVATGGSISITADTVVGLDNSDITANAQTGSGGQVTIDAAGVFGLTFRDQLTPRSDITATSDLGFQSSGTVELLSPDVQLDQAILDIPDTFTGVDNVTVDACRSRASENRFTIVGRRGQPESPDLALRSDIPTIDPQHLSPDRSTPDLSQSSDPSNATREVDAPLTATILEANRFIRTESGGYTLTHNSPVTQPSTLFVRSPCVDRTAQDADTP